MANTAARPISLPSANPSPGASGNSEFIIQFADGFGNATDVSGWAAKQITISSALRAFRRTQLADRLPIPVMNAAGNLRGMVISHSARGIFDISSNIAKKFQRADSALRILNIAVEMGKDARRFGAVWRSNMSLSDKAPR